MTKTENNAANLEPHELRLVAESDQLADRLTNLSAFISGMDFLELDDVDRLMLKTQRDVMAIYHNILNRRLEKVYKQHGASAASTSQVPEPGTGEETGGTNQ